jgi:hypothetical protein
MIASHRRGRLLFDCCSIVIAFGLAGCGGPTFAPVEGKVTLDGQAVSAGRVTFYSADGKSAIIAKISPDGTYRAVDVPCETVRVTVAPLEKLERIRVQRGAKGKASGISEAQAEALENTTKIPEKYADPDASGLTVTVKSGANTYNIEISSKD